MSPEERTDIAEQAPKSLEKASNKGEKTSIFSKFLSSARGRIGKAATAAATVGAVFAGSHAVEKSEAYAEEPPATYEAFNETFVPSISFASVGPEISTGIIGSNDLHIEADPFSPTGRRFVYRDASNTLYRYEPDGDDRDYEDITIDSGSGPVEGDASVYRSILNTGDQRVAFSPGLSIEVDGVFHDALSYSGITHGHGIEIGGTSYVTFTIGYEVTGRLGLVAISDIGTWRPGGGDVSMIERAANVNKNLVVLGNNTILAQNRGSFGLEAIYSPTGQVVDLSGTQLTALGGPIALNNSIFLNDPTLENTFWNYNPSTGRIQEFIVNYESVSESYTATLEIDGTHMGLDAIPAGTSVRVEIPGRPDITQVSTGSDMTISIPDLTEETTITVIVNFPDGVLSGGESEIRREVTVSPEDAVEEIAFDSENEVVVTTRMVTFNLQIHNEAEERDIIEGGLEPSETDMDEYIDTWSTDSFELRDPGAIVGASFENLGDGQYTVTVEIVDGEPVVCDVINTTEGTYVGSIAVDASQRSVSANVPVLTPVTENTPIDVYLEASGEVDGDATIRLVTNGEPGEPVTVSFAPDGTANHTFFAYGVNPDNHDEVNIFDAQVQVDGAWVGLPELMSEGTYNVAMGAGNEALNPEALMQDLIVRGPVQFGGDVELNGNGTDANIYFTPRLADGTSAPEEEIGITDSFGNFNLRIMQVLSNGSVKMSEEELEEATGVSVTGGVLRFEDDLTGVSTEVTIEDLGAIPANLGVIELTNEVQLFTATLEIDGTHMGLDAIPAGTSVRVEIPGRPDITQVSTGSDMTISIPDLTEETTITVTVTFPDGVLSGGESEIRRVITVSAGDSTKDITFSSEAAVEPGDSGPEPNEEVGPEPEPDAGTDAFVDVADAGGDDVPTTDANPDTVADAGMDADTADSSNGNGGGGGKGCAAAPAAPTPSGPLALFAGAIAWINRRRGK